MSVKDGRQKSTPARPSSKATKPNSPVSLKRQPWTALSERKAPPSTDGKKASLRSLQSVLARNSIASSKSSLRSSTSSCHDACKFGGHGTSADCNDAAKFGSKPPARMASKVGAAKLSKPAISKIAVVKSPLRSRHSDVFLNKSVAKTPRENLSSVNSRDQSSINRPVQNAVHSRAQTSVSSRASNSVSSRAPNSVNSRVQNSVNSRASTSVNSRIQNSVNSRAHHSVNSRESFKPSRAVTSTPEGKFKVTRSLFRSPPVPKKILGSKVSDNNKDSIKWQSPVARSLLAAFESPSGDQLLSQAFEEYNCQILDDQAEEEFFRQYYSPSVPGNAAHCVVNNSVHSSGVSEISFEAFSGDPFSEISSPGSLEAYSDEMYRVNNSDNGTANMKMRFRRESGGISDSGHSNPETLNVVLRRQNTQGRKASEDYLIDHVIEEAVNKLSHCEESKVKFPSTQKYIESVHIVPTMPYSSLFRSEEMSLIQLYIPQETAQLTVAELGELGLIQFRDLNPDVNAFQRAFVNEIRRFDEIERHLRFFAAQIAKSEIETRPLAGDASNVRIRNANEVDDLEDKILEHERRITQMNNSYESLMKQYLELTEEKHVLRETAEFFKKAESRQDDIRNSFDEPTAPLLEPDSIQDIEQGEPLSFHQLNLGFVTGVIPRAKMQTFERILWRALRGNLYLNYAEIDEPITDPSTDEVVEKNVFIIFAHGRELLNKIRKISQSLGATLYPVDSNPDKRRESLLEIMGKIDDLNSVLQNTKNARTSELAKVASDLAVWVTIVKKEKAIYHTMNLFNYDVSRKCLIAEGWCPKNDIEQIQNALRKVTEESGSTVPSILNELRTTKEPPTFHRVNKFTSGFQEIVDAYGVAKYREVNPGLFTIITFPFLFAIMFGDLGHGVLVTIAALYLIIREKSLDKPGKSEFLEMFFGGRYIILLMGLFSMYTGFLYNDIFSRPLELFPSGFEFAFNNASGLYEGSQVGVYPIGVDPAWHGSDNYLVFTNSYKMKMSVILGVIQMSFGIILTVFNYTYFRKSISIYTEFIPQMLFMQCIFGYLVFTIILKWSINWYETDQSPPGLLNMLIYMFLQPGTVSEKDQLYPGQGPIQATLLTVALICVPFMLLAKPLILRHEYKKIRAQGYHNPQTDTTRISTDENNEHGGAVVAEVMLEEEEFDFSEVMIHQVIHTIEFCLGCISNTASYLRLWALSLAHAQLSAVLWDMTLKPSFGIKGPLGIVALIIASTLWLSLTIVILLLMEGLSAFLHALRLHWVEFNNKFYEGTGRKFEPFSFKRMLREQED